MNRFLRLVALPLFAAAAGCGGGPTAAAPDGKAALLDLAEGLKTTAADGRKPPAKMAEFEANVEPMTPVAGPAIRAGEIVYLWGAGYAGGGTKLVAYEKKAESEGGWVLLQDGTVKQMTADELKSAERADKGTRK